MIKKNKRKITRSLVHQAYQAPRFRGKHIIIIGGKIYATKSGRASSNLLNRLLKKYPKEIPIITFIPAEDTLILFI